MKNQLKLDFIMIGAAKSGTTSLFNILDESEEIFLPAEKELPFFTNDELYGKGLEYFMDKVYGKAPRGSILGKITPQYMGGQKKNTAEVVAKRIKKELPDVKIVAILRDPVARSFSHYSMAVRLGHEKRDYKTTISELLEPKNLKTARQEHRWTNTYLVGGEYGRILEHYYNEFSKDQILILFTQDLEQDPKKLLERISKFIGASDTFRFSRSKEKSHVGGAKPKTRLLTPGVLYRVPLVKKIWVNVVPFRLRHRMNQKVANWNIQTDSEKLEVLPETEELLRKHYEVDKQKLELLIGEKVPW